jgi:Ribonuclease G/E
VTDKQEPQGTDDQSRSNDEPRERADGSADAASSGDGRRRRRRGRRGRGGRGGRGRGGAQTSAGASDTAEGSTATDAPGTADTATATDAGSAGAGTTGPPAEATPGEGDTPGSGDPAARADGTADAKDAPAEADGDRGGAEAGPAEAGSGRGGSGRDGADKGGSRKGGSAKDGSGKDGASKGGSGKGGSGKGGPAKGASATDASVTDDADVTAEAIAKGGTRVAAKKGNRRGNGGGKGRGQQRPGGVPEEVRRAILEGPPRTMLVTSREDRTQVAVLEDRTVVEHYVTRKEDVTYVGNIYMARVQNVLPGMEAAFLDIGKGRNGVLYAGEVLFDELDLEEGADQRIENVLKPGQKVLVQVTKDPMGSKGPRLTMHLSLAGRYLVLAPNSDLFGISRKLTDKERDRLRRLVKRVKPDHHGVIVRTAAEGATDEQITADVERLLAKWEKVEQAAADAKALTAVYEEPPLVVKVIRDNFGPEFERCTVDDEDLYHQVRGYLDEVAPELVDKVVLYGTPSADAAARASGRPPNGSPSDGDAAATATAGDPAAGEVGADGDGAESAAGERPAHGADDRDGPAHEGVEDDAAATDGTVPGGVDLAAAAARREQLPALFEAYDVSEQLRKAMGRKVWLPSGGHLIIETTEAMKVIDVNTGKFTGGKDTNLEEVVLKTNLEAADEIVRQLRLRDMGGIIVIDFIDMLLKANQEQVVRRLKRELLRDRTKTRVSEVSRLGLVQMTRKNVSQGLIESFSHTCEACEGRGIVIETA